MAPPSERFRPIHKLASHKERKAAAALGESIRQRDAAQQRLEELRQYLAEYLERFANATRNGLPGSQLLEYQVFISKLETAIVQQEEIVRQSQRDCDSSKKNWAGRYTRSKAMENALDRMRVAERKDEDRKEQAESDDRSQRKK